jgi:hypothetical protein
VTRELVADGLGLRLTLRDIDKTGHVRAGREFAQRRRWHRRRAVVNSGGDVCQRAARQARPSDDALCATVRGSPVVTPDETSFGVVLQWLWVLVTAVTTVGDSIGRGLAQAATVIGVDYAGVVVRDGWQPYRLFTRRCMKPVWRICCGRVNGCSSTIRINVRRRGEGDPPVREGGLSSATTREDCVLV